MTFTMPVMLIEVNSIKIVPQTGVHMRNGSVKARIQNNIKSLILKENHYTMAFSLV